MLLSNPRGKKRRKSGGKKRRRARAHHNPFGHKKRRHHRARRNPSLSFMGTDFGEVGLGLVGAAGVEIAGDFGAKFLPEQFRGPNGRLLTKAALALVGVPLVGKFAGHKAAKVMALGSLIVIGFDAFREFVLPHIPGLSDLMPPYDQGLRGYIDEAPPTALSGYLDGEGDGLGRFTPHTPSSRSVDVASGVEAWTPPWG